MAGYQRPGNQQGQQQQVKPAGGFQGNKPKNFGAGNQTSQVKQAAQTTPAEASDTVKAKGNKPKFRLAIVEDDGTGSMKTQKNEEGKTLYVGAAWENKYDGLNIKIEGDIPAGSVVRAYPVDDKPRS